MVVSKVGATIVQLVSEKSQARRSDGLRVIINPEGPLFASKRAHRYLSGSPRRFFELFRIRIDTFNDLLAWLLENTDLRGGRFLTPEFKLMIFLWIIAYNEPQRNAAHMFCISQSTVSLIVNELLDYFTKLCTAFVQLPPDDYLSPEIELNPKNKYFNGCIGAIDGTHVHARIPPSDQPRYRNRKGFISQNVFAAVRFDGLFTCILAGNEGSMNDSRLLNKAMVRGVFRVPDNRYYLADAGFGSRKGIVVPFDRTRYHLQEWHGAPNKPQDAKELYNLRHSGCRIEIEQAFGWLKRSSKIIRETAPEYPFQKQQAFVYAVAGLWNFVKTRQINRSGHKLTEVELACMGEAGDRAGRQLGGKTMDEVRRESAVRHWNSYQRYLERHGVRAT
jgi:hypothetical protein